MLEDKQPAVTMRRRHSPQRMVTAKVTLSALLRLLEGSASSFGNPTMLETNQTQSQPKLKYIPKSPTASLCKRIRAGRFNLFSNC